ncbi:hypothetical protein ACI2TD_18030 [Ralstonia nicotianae]
MKASTALFFTGTVIGLPVFFVNAGALLPAAQIGWLVAVVACGIAGAALWAFECR